MVTESAVWEALGRVRDPEYPISIVDLGMVYGVHIDPRREVTVDMTFTSIGCPAIEMIADDVQSAMLELPGVASCRVNVLWTPPWTKDRITERGRRALSACGVVG